MFYLAIYLVGWIIAVAIAITISNAIRAYMDELDIEIFQARKTGNFYKAEMLWSHYENLDNYQFWIVTIAICLFPLFLILFVGSAVNECYQNSMSKYASRH